MATRTPRKHANKTTAPDAARLTQNDWLDAAFAAVVEGGFDAVRVLSLADALGVTRGSFYWHFEDHAALVRALLARWQAQESALDARLRAAATQDALADLNALLDAALAHAGADLQNIRFELALRGLGRRDAGVAKMLMEVDAGRLALFQLCFTRLTGDEALSGDLAALFYLAVVGSHQAIARPTSPPRLKDYLKGLIARHIIGPHAPRSKAQAPAKTQGPAARKTVRKPK